VQSHLHGATTTRDEPECGETCGHQHVGGRLRDHGARRGASERDVIEGDLVGDAGEDDRLRRSGEANPNWTSTASVDAFMSRRQHQVLKTAIRLDDQLLREAKTRAARAGNLLNEFIENAFRAALLELMDDDRL